MIDTSCRKCGHPMSEVKEMPSKSVARRLQFQITGWRCPVCGHWNDLKRRKDKKDKAKNGI